MKALESARIFILPIVGVVAIGFGVYKGIASSKDDLHVNVVSTSTPSTVQAAVKDAGLLTIKDSNGTVVLTGSDLESAQAGTYPSTLDQKPIPSLTLTLTALGTQKFAAATAANLGKQMDLYIDGQLISSPTVNEVIPDGIILVSGSITAEQAQSAAKKINN